MKSILFLFCLMYVIGCSSSKQEATLATPPILLVQHPLPAIPESVYRHYFTLEIRMLINEDGTVNRASLLKASGNDTWDSLALLSIKKWKYAPALFDNKPVAIWINQKAIIKISDPVYFSLGEILCQSGDEAAKILESLNKGSDFCELALKYSMAESNKNKGILGKVDIYRYPEEICNALKKIKANEYTQPLRFGDKYIIFKRLE